jgi:hypothetical protein
MSYLWHTLRKSPIHLNHSQILRRAIGLSVLTSYINKVMFEGLLESILNKVLGQYIQGLNKKDLSISVWSGDVQLTNVKLRADIFK